MWVEFNEVGFVFLFLMRFKLGKLGNFQEIFDLREIKSINLNFCFYKGFGQVYFGILFYEIMIQIIMFMLKIYLL